MLQTPSPLQVAVGVLFDHRQRVLIARRADQKHQGGLWEFPGGKVEADECVETALAREWREELGVEVLSSRPLIKVLHNYGDLCVSLDVWQIDDFSGQPHGLEGQLISWVEVDMLDRYEFPAANRDIILRIRADRRKLDNSDKQYDKKSISCP